MTPEEREKYHLRQSAEDEMLAEDAAGVSEEQ